MKPISNSYP